MSYIGNEPIVSATRTITEIIATAGQTVFNVNGGYTVGFLDVFINGAQLQTSDFTASNGTTVTLSSATILNDDVRLVAWGTFSVADAAPIANPQFSGTSSLKLPVGTTAQRPASPGFGEVRANSTTGDPEWWDPTTSTWKKFAQPSGYSVEYLVVAGGGGGGSYYSGGGGAGGMIATTTTLAAGTSYTVTIGAGGSGSTSPGNGVKGSDSAITTVVTAIGGGFGAGSADGGVAGGSGGSGGGGGGTGAAAGGSGTAGQGNAGGTSAGAASGGGGGAGAAGANSTGVGGAGLANSISGTSVFYAGGGAGFLSTGGVGGGGGYGGNGTANTGGGGGGYNGTTAGSGGSGIVIIRYLGSQRGTGGTITSSGGYTIHTFTSSGTYNA